MGLQQHTPMYLIASLLVLSHAAYADNLTIPNVFTAGTPARSAAVNGNFAAVESSVDDNAADIIVNTSEISSVSTGVDSNAQDISTVANAVAGLTGSQLYRFAGFSSDLVTGAAGYFGMNAACQKVFGADARMASSQEVIESTFQPILTASAAWVRPVIVAAAAPGTVWDISGFSSATPDISCKSWSAAGGVGLSVTPNGSIIGTGCPASHLVACSTPQ